MTPKDVVKTCQQDLSQCEPPPADIFEVYSDRSQRLTALIRGYVQARGILYVPIMPCCMHLVEESNDLSCNVLSSSLFVIHDTGRGGENNMSKLTGWQQLDDPLLELTETDVVSWGDDTGLVEAM